MPLTLSCTGSNVKHPLLDPHSVIAWDMDGTLIDGTYSAFFREYILAHPEKTHYIVTFRTGKARQFATEWWRDECDFELHHHGVPHGTIKAIYGVPDHLYHAYAQMRSFFNPDRVQEFLEWKGLKASELGASLLVDDMEQLVVSGCDRYGVDFVNSEDPAFANPSEQG